MSEEERLKALEDRLDFFEHVLSVQGGENEAYRAVIEAILRHVSTVPEVRQTILEMLEVAIVANLHGSTNSGYSGGFDRVVERLKNQMGIPTGQSGYTAPPDPPG